MSEPPAIPNDVSAEDVKMILEAFMEAVKKFADSDMSPRAVMVAQLFLLECSFQASQYTKAEVVTCLQSLINNYSEDNIEKDSDE